MKNAVDAIAGDGATKWLIETHLCWGHVRVVCHLPPPPETWDELQGCQNSPKAQRFMDAMELCYRWDNPGIKAPPLQGRDCRFWKRFFTGPLAFRKVAMPPVFLAQVCPHVPAREVFLCVRGQSRSLEV